MKFQRKGKTIGTLENGIFSKTIDPSKHIMRRNNSIGIDLETFKSLPEDTQIMLLDDTNKKVYRSDWKTYAENGTVEDWGHGWQIFLSRDKFNQ